MERTSRWETGEYRMNFKFPQQWIPLLKLAVPILLALWLLSGIYIVRPGEQGVVRRFGKVVRTTEPGPHYRLPSPIEKVDKPKIQQVRRIEIGVETVSPGPPAMYRFHPEESMMLTGDEQIIDAQIIVQYKIKDPADYLFNVRNLEGQQGTIKDAAEVALRQVVGKRPIDDVLISEKLQVEIDIRTLLQEIVDGYESGIRIIEVKLQTVQPPKEVAASFSDVVSAKEDKDKLIQEAEGYKEDIIPKARGHSPGGRGLQGGEDKAGTGRCGEKIDAAIVDNKLLIFATRKSLKKFKGEFLPLYLAHLDISSVAHLYNLDACAHKNESKESS